MKKVSSFRTIKQGQNRVLEADANARLKVDSFIEPFAALNIFKSGSYDLIMIDIVLPNMNRFEPYYAIKQVKCIMKRLERNPILN